MTEPDEYAPYRVVVYKMPWTGNYPEPTYSKFDALVEAEAFAKRTRAKTDYRTTEISISNAYGGAVAAWSRSKTGRWVKSKVRR